MAYTSGDTILDDHYNLFAKGTTAGTGTFATANVDALWGNTNGDDIGYGQASPLSAVSAGTTVTATQWANLLNRISTIASHQGSSITSISNPTAGTTITALAALQTNINTIWNNRNNAAASGSTYTTGGTVTRTANWQNTVTFTMSATFANQESLDRFWNMGGRLTLTASLGTGSGNKHTEWADLINKLGTINATGKGTAKTIAGISYLGFEKKGGGGTPTVYVTSIGGHGYTSTYTESFRQYADTAPYTANYISITRRISTAGKVDFQVIFQDAANTNTDEIMTADLTVNLAAVLPSTTHLSNSWGSITLSGSQSGS